MAKYPTDDYDARLEQLVAAGDRDGAAKHFMRNAVGVPAPLAAVMSLLPMFKAFAANGLTLPFRLRGAWGPQHARCAAASRGLGDGHVPTPVA